MMKKFFAVLTFFFFVNVASGHATFIPIRVEEEDGSPSISATQIFKFSNDSVTDNGSGSVSVDTSSGGGSDNLGDHTATQDINMDSNSLNNVNFIYQGNATGSLIDMTAQVLNDQLGNNSVQWDNRIMTNSTFSTSLDWENQLLQNGEWSIREDSTSNTTGVQDVLNIYASSSAVAANTFGAGLTFDLENAGNTVREQARIDVELDDATNPTEDATMTFNIRQSGTVTEIMRLDGTDGNVGIGDTTPASALTVGSSDAFQVNSSGDIVSVDGVAYDWPSSQGAASTVLSNNGSGTLSWATGFFNGGAAGANVQTISSGSSTNVGSSNYIMIFRTSGTHTVNLPPVATSSGKVLFIKAMTDDLTLDPSGTEFVDDNSTYTLTQGDGVVAVCDGSRWYLIGTNL